LRRRRDGDARRTSQLTLVDAAAARPAGEATQSRGRRVRQDDKAMPLRHRRGGNARRTSKSAPRSRRRTQRGAVVAGREAT